MSSEPQLCGDSGGSEDPGRRAISASFAVVAASLFLSCGSQELGPADIPQEFLFLIFPSRPVVVYASSDVRAGEEIGEIDRAVTASHAEIRSGTITVLLDETTSGFARAEKFSFVPLASSGDMIDRWNKTIGWQGYTKGEWDARPEEANLFRVRLKLIDNDHSRWETFEYLTDGKSIERVLAPVGFPAVGVGAIVLLVFAVLLVLSAILAGMRWMRRGQ